MIGYCLALIATIFSGELGLKNYVEEQIPEGTTKKVCGGKLTLHNFHNRGACFNLGSRNPFRMLIVSVLMTVLVTVGFVLAFYEKTPAVLKCAFSLILGGAYSNTYDRLKRKYVVDYLRIQNAPDRIRRLIFNISDLCILAGSILVVLACIEEK